MYILLSKPENRLSEKQKKVFDAVIEGRKSVFFTGAAGTGKSYLLNLIIQKLQTMYKAYEIGVTASTGIAAINIGGCTLHSYLGLGLATESIDVLKYKVNKFKKVRNRWNNTRVLIIDEISMIDSVFFDKVETIARYIRKNNLPFGGIQVIATGDFLQLPPVQSNKLCFESQAWDNVFHEMIELTEIFRQHDRKFKEILNEVRYGNVSVETEIEIRKLNRPVQCPPDIDPIHLYPLNVDVDRENQRRLAELKGPSRTYLATDSGDKNYFDKLEKHCPAPKVLELKLDAQVCLVRNLDRTLVNGSLGVVKGFDNDGFPIVSFPSVNRVETIHRQQWEIKETMYRQQWEVKKEEEINPNFKNQYDRVLASRIQVPLILAWALSIHKSQGQTLDYLRVDLSKTFEYGQAYVALSRATTMNGIQVIGFSREKVRANPKALLFSKRFT